MGQIEAVAGVECEDWLVRSADWRVRCAGWFVRNAGWRVESMGWLVRSAGWRVGIGLYGKELTKYNK